MSIEIPTEHYFDQYVLVECHSSKLGCCEWLPGRVTGLISALDRPYRVNLMMDNGCAISEAAPECVKPYSKS